MEFRYIASDQKTGRQIIDVTTADDVSALVMRLKNEGLLPIKIREVKSSNEKLKVKKIPTRGRVKGKEVAIFTRQLATTLGAGLLLTEALDTIADDLENRYFRGIVTKISEDIQGGTNFSVALAKYPKLFPVTYTAIVKSGEATGTLHKTMGSLAKYLEDSERLKEKVKSAIRYPLFIVCFAFFVVAVIVLFLIPRFTVMFAGAGAQLPLLTRIVVGVSNFALHYTLQFLMTVIVCWLLYLYLSKFYKVRFWIDALKLKLPIVGKEIIQKDLLSRFCRTLGVLLSGGVGLSYSLEISSQVVNHLLFQESIDRVRIRVISGSNISDELRTQKMFPHLVSKMIAVGEKTGRLDDMLKRTADYYDEELDTTLQNLTALLEPALIIFIGGIVLIAVLALYLPIFKLSTAVR